MSSALEHKHEATTSFPSRRQAILHFTHGLSESKAARLYKRAKEAKLEVERVLDCAVRVTTTSSDSHNRRAHDKFVARYRRDRKRHDLAVFHDHSDTRHTRQGRYRSRLKWNKTAPGGSYHARTQTSAIRQLKPTSSPAADGELKALAAPPTEIPSKFDPKVDYGRTARVLSQFYNFPEQQQQPRQQQSAPVIAIVSFDGSYRMSDLEAYWRQVLGLGTIPRVVNVAVDGAAYPFTGSGSDSENTLDLEIAGAICPSCTLLFLSAPNTDTGFYNAILTAIQGVRDENNVAYKPTAISISWGSPESEYSHATLVAMNQLFRTAVQQGITVTGAAGNDGSSDGVGDGRPHADFPGSCPWVVSCGGTSIAASGYESVWSWSPMQGWGTGGGISAAFGAGPHQKALGPLIPYPSSPDHLAARKGNRAVPDISMVADPNTGWTIVFNGQVERNIGGTSCVAPAVAALVGLMNRTYSGAGNDTFLGRMYQAFADPKLRSACFRDIVSGSNDNVSPVTGGFFGLGGTRGTSVFSAAVGYDFCTGVGVPHGVNLMQAIHNLATSQS